MKCKHRRVIVGIVTPWRYCHDCMTTLSFGPSSDDSLAVHLEIRLARYLSDLAVLWEPGAHRTSLEDGAVEWCAMRDPEQP